MMGQKVTYSMGRGEILGDNKQNHRVVISQIWKLLYQDQRELGLERRGKSEGLIQARLETGVWGWGNQMLHRSQ